MRSLFRAFQAVIVGVGILTPAFGGDTLADKIPAMVLVDQCRTFGTDRGSVESTACEAFIRGFLDGAQEQGSRHATCPPGEESFTERAARTRLGVGKRAPAPFYCVADDTRLDRIVELLITHAESNETSGDLSASQMLMQLFRREFPCNC